MAVKKQVSELEESEIITEAQENKEIEVLEDHFSLAMISIHGAGIKDCMDLRMHLKGAVEESPFAKDFGLIFLDHPDNATSAFAKVPAEHKFLEFVDHKAGTYNGLNLPAWVALKGHTRLKIHGITGPNTVMGEQVMSDILNVLVGDGKNDSGCLNNQMYGGKLVKVTEVPALTLRGVHRGVTNFNLFNMFREDVCKAAKDSNEKFRAKMVELRNNSAPSSPTPAKTTPVVGSPVSAYAKHFNAPNKK